MAHENQALSLGTSMLKLLRRAANAIGVLLFALLFLVFVVQVTARVSWGRAASS